MSKTIARGAHVVTDTSRHNSRPIISVLDRNSLRDSLSGTIRESRREVAGRVYSGVRSGRGKFKKAVAGEAMSAARQLYFLMDASAPTLRNIPLETIQNLMPQAIEMAFLQLLMQRPESGLAIRESVWSMVAAGMADGIADAEEKFALQQSQVSAQPKERHKLKVATPAQLRDQVLSRGEWLTAQEVSENAGYQNANPSVQPNKWKKAGKIFAITVDGKDRFPAYALGVDGKPLPQMAEVLSVLGPHRQPLAIASWFASANSWLGSKTPMESIADNPQGVLMAAKMEVAPIEHG
ncbi:TPA: hypothetical protein QHB43_003301 [Aeromonas hydrophila subsp. hydrophila]|nr:hypothetical protein [Aeromonas hydrophila subsp. hydrophila]